jgi:hypothetical protein
MHRKPKYRLKCMYAPEADLLPFFLTRKHAQGLMFSHKYMQQICEGAFDWPQHLHFAVDLKAPGQRVRILNNKTFCSFER